MIWLILAAALCPGGCNASSEAEQFMAPVIERIESEQAKLANLPADADLKTRFASVHVLDQHPRQAMGQMGGLSPDERDRVRGQLGSLMKDLDRQNLAIVLEHLPPEGWYLQSRYGIEVATTAFLVVQHSDLETWRRFVPVLEPLVAQGEVSGTAYAMMYDRLALAEGRAQAYGTQMTCMEGEWQAINLEAPETVDQRRREMGFPTTQAEYEAGFASYSCS